MRHCRISSRSIVTSLVAVGLLALVPRAMRAQTEYFFPASETFDEVIPSPQEFLGYPIGTFHTGSCRFSR
jgi:hypothetical protein